MAVTGSSDTVTHRGAGAVRLPRSRGALSGFVLMVLGAWGALIPFIGPYFSYAYTPDSHWTWTIGRFWLEVLPGAATFLAGFLLLTTSNRAVAVFGGWLASLAGAWFVVGEILGRLLTGRTLFAGVPVGSPHTQVVEAIGFFYGLGAVIMLIAAHVSGRLSVRSVRDVRAAERRYADGALTDDAEG